MISHSSRDVTLYHVTSHPISFSCTPQVYEGEFVEDKRCGAGTYTWPTGDKFQGQFMDDAKDGQGEFFFSNGNIFKVCGDHCKALQN